VNQLEHIFSIPSERRPPLSSEQLQNLDNFTLEDSDFAPMKVEAQMIEDIVEFLIQLLHNCRNELKKQLQRQQECSVCLKTF
jgi:hypothetical protein